MNLFCAPGETIGLAGAVAFVGVFLSCLVLPKLVDTRGRHCIWYITVICTVLIFPPLIYTKHILWVYVANFFGGFSLVGRFQSGFVLLNEFVPKKYQVLASTLFLCFDTISTWYLSFYMRYISNVANQVVWIGFGCNLFAIATGYFLHESPTWLVTQDREEEAIEILEKVAKTNGVTDFKVDGLRKEKFETEDPDKVKENAVEDSKDDSEIETSPDGDNSAGLLDGQK